MSVFGDNLSKAIQKSGISKKELAQLLDTTTTTIYRWEKGIHEASDAMKHRIARVLGVSVAYLMGEGDTITKEGNHIVNITEGMYPLSTFSQNAFRGGALPMADGSTPMVHVHREVLATYDPDNAPYVVELEGGTQMERNARLYDGDCVVVNPALEPSSGALAFVVYNGVPLVRRIFIAPDGSWSLQSDLPPVEVSADGIANGVVIYRGRIVLRYAVEG